MFSLIHLIARPFEALLGLFCVLTAIVLYPNEEGRIQSKFEDFWIRVDDFQNLALSRHAAFMTQVAKLESRFLDSMFGHKLISVQAVGVSFAISLLSLSMVCFWISANGEGSFPKEDAIFATGILTASLIIGATSIPRRANLLVRGAGFVCAVVVLAYVLKTHYFEWITPDDLPVLLLVPILGGLICDIIFIIITRRLLAWAGEMKRPFNVLAVVLLNLLMALLLISPLLAFTAEFKDFTSPPVIFSCLTA